jgi:hypothetical protein
MKSQVRREMFTDLYRIAEHYEDPPFQPGDIDGNADWFVKAQDEMLKPFLLKYQDSTLATELAFAVVEDASRKAAEMNKTASVL